MCDFLFSFPNTSQTVRDKRNLYLHHIKVDEECIQLKTETYTHDFTSNEDQDEEREPKTVLRFYSNLIGTTQDGIFYSSLDFKGLTTQKGNVLTWTHVSDQICPIGRKIVKRPTGQWIQ